MIYTRKGGGGPSQSHDHAPVNEAEVLEVVLLATVGVQSAEDMHGAQEAAFQVRVENQTCSVMEWTVFSCMAMLMTFRYMVRRGKLQQLP